MYVFDGKSRTERRMAAKSFTEVLTPSEVQAYRQLFDIADSDKSGQLRADEVHKLMNDAGVQVKDRSRRGATNVERLLLVGNDGSSQGYRARGGH